MALHTINSNVSRLTQRITENFKESTRDIPLFQGATNSSASYFEYNTDKLKDISSLLEGGGDKSGAGSNGVGALRGDAARLEGMKRLIAMISKGRDMSSFFAQVVKQVASPSIEIRKLVYIYLLRYASSNTDLLLLSINTFQKDLSDSSPLIRSMSLRVLTSIRLPVIQGILMIGLKKLAIDRNPWVRKTVALGLPKVYDMDASTQPLLLPILTTLLQSPSPITLGASLTAFNAICPDNLSFLHAHYRRICRLLVDADEWGQVVALDILVRYARAMLEKPEASGSTPPGENKAKKQPENGEDEEDQEELDPDIELLLHCAIPLFQSRNSAVVLGNVKLFYLLAPASHEEVGQDKLVRPLLRLMNGLEGEEVRAIATEVCRQVAEERAWLLSSQYSSFLLHSTDSIRVKRTKIRILNALLTADNAETLIAEFQEYIRFPEAEVSQDAIKAVGNCARMQSSTRKLALGILIRLLNSTRDASVGHAVVVLKSLVQPDQSSESVSESIKLVSKLVRQLPEITNGSARACVYWLAGQYAESPSDNQQTAGTSSFEGLQPWAPDTLRLGAKEFIREPSLAKLQILTLAAKLLVLCPTARPIHALSTYVFNLARYDEDWDVRDRARFLKGLLRSISQTSDDRDNQDGQTDETQGDAGGVVLRREQIKMVLLAAKESMSTGIPPDERRQRELLIGTLSSLAMKRLPGYEPLADWADDPTDSSLRDIEEEQPVRPFVASRTASFQTQSPQTITSPAFASVGSGSPASASVQRLPPVAKSRFQNLDDFLNESESEEETEESDNGQVQGDMESEDASEEDSEETTDDESVDESHELVRNRQ